MEKSEFGVDSDDDSDVENYLPTYRRRKPAESTDAESKPPSMATGARLGTSAKASKADDSDEDDELDAPGAKAASSSGAPSKPPSRAPPVAQAKGDGAMRDAFVDIGVPRADDSDEEDDVRAVRKKKVLDAERKKEAPERGETSVEQRRAAMLRCCARGGDTADTHQMQQCFITRDKSGTNFMSPVYRLWREAPGETADGASDPLAGCTTNRSRATFLASAKKRTYQRSSNFLISLEHNPTDRKEDEVVGKLRGDSLLSTQYMIYDHGLNPTKTETKRLVRKELGLIQFEYDQVGTGKVRVALPSVTPSGVIDVWQPEDPEMRPEQTIAGVLARKSGARADAGAHLLYLDNKKPTWDEGQKGYVLNFRGRVTKSSVKNLQLRCEEASGELTVLQFGRVESNLFTMDYAHPLCALQAFAICLSVFDAKVTDSSALESMFGAKATDDEAAGGHDEGREHHTQGSMSGSSSMFGGLTEKFGSKSYRANKEKRMGL